MKPPALVMEPGGLVRGAAAWDVTGNGITSRESVRMRDHRRWRRISQLVNSGNIARWPTRGAAMSEHKCQGGGAKRDDQNIVFPVVLTANVGLSLRPRQIMRF